MASQIASANADITTIKDEDLLRKMWHDAQDFGRKREIRAHMYKLREERLKALYAPGDAPSIAPSSPYIMEQHNTSSAKFGLSKTSVTGSHGDSLADQSFESFKTKEIRDSESPTRFGTVIPSDNSGWHVTSSEERSADGKTHTLRSSATTEGTKDIQGGRTSFTGKNEEVSSERFEGDDKNFVRSSGDQSATFLAENTVLEGEDGSTISKKSTSTSSSSTKVVRSQQTFGDTIELPPANTNIPEFMCGHTASTREESTKTTTQTQETDGNVTSKHLSSDPDRVSEAFRLAELPGKVIERDVRMINPSTRMITITKKLEDGTTVTTRNYEKVGVEPEKPFDQQAHAETQKRLNAAVEALNSKSRDEIEHRSVKKDITEKVTNLQFITEERSETERVEQVKKQQQEAVTQQKVTIEVDPAHDSFARSLRCVSPTESTRSVRSNSTTGRSSVSPDKSTRGRRSPSRECDTSRLSTHTTTRSSRTDVSSKDYMKPTITSERKQSTFKETVIQESSTSEAYDTVDKTKLRERSLSPRKVPQNSPDMTPRGQSPDKFARNVSPSKTPKESVPFCSVDTTPVKRESSPVKLTSEKLIRENSSESFNVDTTITISTTEDKQKQHQMREDVELIDTKKIVSENDDITINVKLENVTDDIEVTTTVEEVGLDEKKSTEDQETTKSTKTPKQKPPLVRSETFEERCRRILGMPEKADSIEETTEETNTSSVFSTYDNTVTRSSEIREKRKKLEQEIKTIESETMRAARKTNEFLAGERRPSAPASSPDRKAGTASPTKSTSPVRKHSQPSPERRPQPSKDSSPIRKHSQPSPERRPKEEAPAKKPVEINDQSPIRKHSQPSPDRRPKDEQSPQRKPVEPKDASPVRKHSQPSPVRKPSEQVKEPSPHRCSRSHDRSPSPKMEKSPVQKVAPTQIDSTVVTKTTTSKAEILINQKKEGKNTSVTEITIQPVIDAKKSDKVLTKQTSDTKFDRRSTSSRVVTNKSSSDFDVKRKAYIAEKTESERPARTTTTKVRTPATSPEKRRPLDTSPTKTDKTKHHITVAKIKIEPVRKPLLAKVVVEDRSSKVGRTSKTTKKVVDEYTEPESDKDTGISDNEIEDETTTVETTTTTITTTKKSDRKDSAPVSRTTGTVEKSYARSSSDNVLKSNNVTKKTTAAKSATATTTTTTASTSKKIERPVKCVTTKTINLSAKPTIDSDILDNVVIDIQHAKSSREPTPNKLIPIPVSPDEDTGKPRYPDAVQEPDDEPKHAPKVSNVPIFEEATNEYIGCEITEVEDHEVRAARACRITNLDRVTEDDESLMSVTQKVSKFVEEANKLKDAQSKTPNRFVRCEYDDMDEHLKSDECLLSVSDKVTKFISTAEEVKKIKTSGPFVPECKVTVDVTESDECLKSVNEKVSKFATVDSQKTTERKTTTMKTTLDDMDRSFVEEDDDSLLSVSEKKKKFISGTTVPQKSPELVKNVMKQTSKHERNLDEDVGGVDSEHRTNITERYTTATLTKPKDKVPQSVALRSTEAVKKAKQLFENGNKPAAAELARQKDILSRPSIWEDRRKKEQVATVTTSQKDVKLTDIGVYKKPQEKVEPEPLKEEPVQPKQEAPKSRRDSGPKTPAYIKDTVSTKKDLFEKRISSSKLETSELIKSTTSQEDRTEYMSTGKRPSITEKYERTIARDTPTPGNKPSYMNHTVSSLEHMNTGRRESIDMTQRSVKVEETVQQQDTIKSTSKYDADLKRADSGKNVLAAQVKRKPSIDSTVIEDIFELEVLEKMLESVTGYEQRRRIRAQIRLVKKSPASSVTTTTTTTTHTTRTNSRVREPSPKRKDSSPTRPMTMRKGSQDTEARVTKTVEVEKKTEQAPRSASPTKSKPLTNGKATTATSTVTTTLKTSRFGERVAPQKEVKEDKPIWATSNILKKASETTRSFRTTSTTSTPKKTTTTMRDVPKETKPTDCITSSYGVGPTDENGLPLFGIRALKKKSAPAPEPETTTKVTGSIFTETLYSENGSAPVGERKTTLYSSDAKDLENMNLSSSKRSLAEVREKLLERENSRKGLISVTKTEKIGNGTSHVTTEVGALEDLPQRDAKVVRKGSVRELTERFVHKESSSSLMSEKTYPKAGLILRSTHSHSSRSSTPCENMSLRSGSVDFDENDIELRTSAAKSSFRTTSMAATEAEECEDGGVVFRKSQSSSSRQQQTRSFLNDGSRVSGVQDVLDRMRNADNLEESGDSAEDREARALLNKFLGASVLMSGMESMMASSTKEEMSTAEGSSAPGSKKVSKVTTTRTVKSTASSSSNAPKPSIENLEQIWDEAVLKQLLESSTNYEERRKIRARLRQIMSEKEACADIVASVTADLQRERQQLQQQKSNDSSGSGIHGESLLLPLLQGILLHNKSGAGGQIGTGNGGSTAVALPIPPVEDSGTESGEDLRLLAAGLHDNIEMYRGIGVGNAVLNGGVNGDGSSVSNGRLPVDSGDSILHEVTAALQRLQLSLRDGKNIQLESNKRNALLTLVNRLQTGLMQPDKLPDQVSPVNELADDNADDKVDYNQARRGSARFAKRRNRNNRHTVGVSREELADARRFIEEIGRMESLSAHSNSATPEKSKTPEKPLLPYSLQKQQSLGTVLPSTPSVPTASTFAMKRPSQFVPKELNQNPDPIPLVNGRDRKAKQRLFRQSQSFEQPSINGYEPAVAQHKPIDIKPVPKNEPFKKPVQTAAQRALVKKYAFNDGSTSEDDEPRKTAEQVVLQKNTPKGSTVVNTVQKIVNREVKQDAPTKSVHTSIARKTAIHRSHTPESHEAPVSTGDRPMNKYTSKKLRMKRANTIDIPKKLLTNGADSDDDSEEDQPIKPKERPREVKAKTPVATAPKPAPVEVPDFKPKTDNDMKFMAFLQKQNQATKQMWTNPVKEHVGTNNWTSKFGHLKNNFESVGRQGNQPAPMRSAPKSSAMNFWKKAESNSFDESYLRQHAKPPKPVHTNHVAPKPPTLPKLPPKPANNPVQQPPALPAKPKTAPQPLPQPVAVSKPEPKHPPMVPSQFTHAPTSAFKPIPKKLPPANLDFKPIHQEPEIIKPIPSNVSCGIVKNIVASGFKETPEVKPEPKPVQLGLVKSLAAAGYHETPYVPLPKIERTPTHHVLNYQAQNPERAESPTPPAPWVGKKTAESNGRVASIASTKFTANQFGMNKGSLPAQTSLTYQGSLKYDEKPLSFQVADRMQGKRPSLPDVHKATLPAAADNFMYTFTDYTQPESVSTFSLNRSDSLTNPENQPLVLTNTNSVYSPAGQQMTYLGVNDRRDSSSLSPSNIVIPIDDDVDDLESLDSQEMRVVTKVMRAPVSQQASYSSNKPSHLNSGDERGSMIAQNLHSSLKKIQQKSPTPPNKIAIAAAAAAQKRFSQDFSSSSDGHSPYGQRPAPQFAVPKVEITPQTPATTVPLAKPSQFSLPAHVIYNNVQGMPQSRPAYQPAPLARTDSWVRLNQQPAPNALSRAKSSHTLAVPPSYDGGFGQPNRNVSDKQRTMEAYFAGQKPTLNALSKTSSSHNILRDKSGMSQNSARPVSYALGHSYNPAQYNIMTSQHTGSSYQQQQQSPMYSQRAPQMMIQQQQPQYYQPPLGGGLSRSRTMPHIPMNNVSLLDEDNVEDAFEELMSQSFAV